MPSVNGLPSVTQILGVVGLSGDFSHVPADMMEIARHRGSAVHAAIEAHHYGYEHDLEPQWKPWFDAYLRFSEETKDQPIVSEALVIHDAWGYCGHVDRVSWLTVKDFAGHRTVLDFKSGAADGVAYQLAGYAEAYNAMHPTERVDRAAAVALRKNGTYRLVPVDLRTATPVWYAAVTVFRARGGK